MTIRHNHTARALGLLLALLMTLAPPGAMAGLHCDLTECAPAADACGESAAPEQEPCADRTAFGSDCAAIDLGGSDCDAACDDSGLEAQATGPDRDRFDNLADEAAGCADHSSTAPMSGEDCGGGCACCIAPVLEPEPIALPRVDAITDLPEAVAPFSAPRFLPSKVDHPPC